VFEADEETDKEIPVAAHARRASVTVANRFSQPQTMLPDSHQERGTSLLRRLSLSSAAFTKVSLICSYHETIAEFILTFR
jgi:hypothetical protein